MSRPLLAGILLVSTFLAGCGGNPVGPDGEDSDVLVLTSANFETLILEGLRPALVEFYLPTCPACAAMVPVVERLATRYEGRVTVGKVDVTQEMSLSDACEVVYVPTFILMENGVEKERIVGAVPEEQLAAAIEGLLAAASSRDPRLRSRSRPWPRS